MNKKLRLVFTLGLALSCTTFFVSNVAGQSLASGESIQRYLVDFFENYLREEFTLSSGYAGKGNNLLYKTVEVQQDQLVAKPEDPVRANYDFVGWFKEENCINEWNFATEIVTKNTRLFAKWEFASEEVEPEPEYTPPSTVLDEEAATDYEIDSVMNFAITNNTIKVSSSAIAKLTASKDNVLPLMEYRVKASKTITATYGDDYITITCGDATQKIKVVNDSINLVVANSTYETKAKNYEAKALEEESYHVMLAGSSSIEFWDNSKEALDPIVSYNHGIGGTTIEDWNKCLNKRLVYPYKPKMVVYYVGINNVINSKQDADTIWTNLEQFFDDTHEAMPNTKVQYIMMNLIPGYPTYFETINNVNNRVIRYQKENSSWLTLINPGLALLKQPEGVEGTQAVGKVVKVESNIELSAVWADGEDTNEYTYTISFNPNGGTGEMESVGDVANDYELPECTFEAPTNKKFVGWRVNGQGMPLEPGTVINVVSDIELVAFYMGNEIPEELKGTFTVRFNPNGAEGTMSPIDYVSGSYVLPGCAFKAPEGKHFAGWRVYGDPNAAYFRTDGLHLSNYGYVIWGGIIRQSIVDGLSK